MKTERRYVLLLDEGRKHIRIFRADCEMRPPGTVLWEGDGLRSTYDAMVRLNRDRKPPVSYVLCHLTSSRGVVRFRIFKSVADIGWTPLSNHTSRKAAIAARTDAAVAFAARRAEEEARLKARLEKVGVVVSGVPKITEKDRRYLDWYESRGDLFEDAA